MIDNSLRHLLASVWSENDDAAIRLLSEWLDFDEF
jgi:hypothetical protein